MMECKEHAGRIIIDAPNWDTNVVDGQRAPRIFVDLSDDAMANSEETLCTASVKFSNGNSAVVHFCVRVDDNGKVTGKITAGARTRDVIKTVNVPVWNRRHV